MTREFEFQGTIHRTSKAMHDAIAEEWLSAGGSNTLEDILQLLQKSNAHLAAEAAAAFGLDDTPSFSRTLLRDAFAHLRDELESRFPAG